MAPSSSRLSRARAASSNRSSKATTPRPKTRRVAPSTSASDDGDKENDEYRDEPSSSPRPVKRRKVASSKSNAAVHGRLFARDASVTVPDACLPPARSHSLDYHKPLLLSSQHGRRGRASLLSWFDSVSATRAMPWRKPWIDPRLAADDDGAGGDDELLRARLERRAYEVWISEIMLQQTRVAVVIDYWNRWTARWPTIHDLARADPDDVLAAWRGLGYYSRATRIHEAAKLAVADPDMRGLLPSSAAELEARVPGVGRYTAGAISSIVFGRPAPMVDGNVLRVLSRQLGVYGNVKTDRAVIDAIWAAADALVQAVAADGDEVVLDEHGVPTPNDRPGRWGQALMELGSTVCTPKPNCASCPITATCRAYSEGLTVADKTARPARGGVADIEDACTLCVPMEQDAGHLGDRGEDDVKPTMESQPPEKKRGGGKQLSLADFAFKVGGAGKPAPGQTQAASKAAAVDVAVEHARKFPLKVAKKAVREEETLVCAIRRPDGSYLLQRRPEKGLLAGLWEFPSSMLDSPKGLSTKRRTELAKSHAAGVLPATARPRLRHLGELGSVPWLFSHLKLTMHVHLFAAAAAAAAAAEDGDHVEPADGETRPMRWSGDVDGESMGTGMRKCWALVRDAEG
ncbi:A/G-specific adenine DNA glycosylase [Purpureocillium lavendulum]|uniref:Adenine DNA glycosylase n=1 Tax=Purpureocillium lavendulum TaxID=1247861 RepID=A0AB34FWE1_9HYPO|nr:A/G-specific adenine DNA glycosylase [Purpureocillium lavendulum]